ncbi:hypothetical protein FE257_008636 [Aspergillus nanangensis]|uniref:Carboxylesterase type B domain-containing protein n=1 Tax=Aspergillus nanangensis TaxID=2582783 RepID=A0AAD4CL52_ASPNN|nr:hypothetical protein FE257_008636 [Aspergillus nanangensis]
MTVEQVPEPEPIGTNPIDTINQKSLPGCSEDVTGWWSDLGQLFARLLQLGEHTLEEQYRHLRFLFETVIPALGPHPCTYPSAMTLLGAPLDTSLKFYRDGPPLVRVALEPLSYQSGTPTDPFNQLPSSELVTTLVRLNLPGFDTAIYDHFAEQFALSPADATRLHDQGQLGTQRALGFELRGGDILPKGYVFPRLSHMATGTPIRDMIMRAVGDEESPVKSSNWMPGLAVVDEYVSDAGGFSPFTFLAWDFVCPAKSRLKVYGTNLNVNLTTAKEVWMMGGRFNDPETRTGWELLERLWYLLGIKSHEVRAPDNIESVETKASHYQGPILWNYEIQPGSARPIAKLYLCVHGLNDLGVARGLAKFFASIGWAHPARSYVEALAAMYPDVDIGNCPQDSPPNIFANDTSEDCLSINVIRPASIPPYNRLPVLVWIYGGGFDGGGTSDPRYNLSGIVNLSQKMSKPIIGVSFNYRINKLGFMQDPSLPAEGSSNAGFHDQRLALMWIQENIAAFGGDPMRVTIWGESAGAQSVGLHLFVHDGRDEGLFHAGIMESGGPVGVPMQSLSWYAGYVESLATAMGCASDVNGGFIQCLRTVSTERWQNTKTTGLIWNPMVDGDLWSDNPSVLAEQGKFGKIPIIMGTNSDEGCTFAAQGLDTDEQLLQSLLSYRRYNIRPPMAQRLMKLYPNDPAHNPPYSLNPNPAIFPDRGLQWRRAAAMEGDMVMVAGRRRTCEQMAKAKQPVYSYRFDTFAYGSTIENGVGHFQNVAYNFQNISGNLGPLPQYASHKVLSENIGRSYISFVHDHNPNTSSGNSTLPYWPKYDIRNPKNIVLNESRSWIESDTYRKEGMAFLNEVASDIQVLS